MFFSLKYNWKSMDSFVIAAVTFLIFLQIGSCHFTLVSLLFLIMAHKDLVMVLVSLLC